MKIEIEYRPFVTVSCIEQMLRLVPQLLPLPNRKILHFLKLEIRKSDPNVQLSPDDLRRAKRRVLEDTPLAPQIPPAEDGPEELEDLRQLEDLGRAKARALELKGGS